MVYCLLEWYNWSDLTLDKLHILRDYQNHQSANLYTLLGQSFERFFTRSLATLDMQDTCKITIVSTGVYRNTLPADQ